MSSNPSKYLADPEKSTTRENNLTTNRDWRSGKTTIIRVPEKFAHRLLLIARQWDEKNQ